jgi:hypothetical protein
LLPIFPRKGAGRKKKCCFSKSSSPSKKNGFRMLVRIRTRKNGNILFFVGKREEREECSSKKRRELEFLPQLQGTKKADLCLFLLFSNFI